MWYVSVPQRRASLNEAAPTGMSMNSWKSMEFLACAPPFSTFSIGTGSAWAFEPADGAVERDLEVVGDGLGAGQRDGQERVRPQPALVGRPVQIDERVVDGPLVQRVQSRHRGGDLAVDVRDRVLDTPLPP